MSHPTPFQQHLDRIIGPLTPALFAEAGGAKPLHLKKGQSLLRAGEHWRHLWWIQQGALRLYYLDRNGQAANKNFYLDGAMIWPITPALRHEPVLFWIEALTTCEVWATPWEAWANAVETVDPWTRLEHQTLSHLLQDKMAREHAFLQLTATERYCHLLAEHPDWCERIPLRHQASWLGITDVALSRIRRRLKTPV